LYGKVVKGIDPLAVMTVMADPSRLGIVKALLEGPQVGEELSHHLHIAPSTVSFHLKKLESVGLVSKMKDQYYAVYSVNSDVLDLTIRELIEGMHSPLQTHGVSNENYRQKVLGIFFDHGKLKCFPIQKKKRRIILEAFAVLFEPGRTYSERDTNEIISGFFDDYCTIRRELINEGLLTRKGQIYQLSSQMPSTVLQRTDLEIIRRKSKGENKMSTDRKDMLKKQYKQNPPPAGIFKITNNVNGKVFIGKGMNVKGRLNGQELQLKWGSHHNKALQEDWNKFGSDQFSFEIIDYLEPSSDPAQNLASDLADLEQLWIVKFQPYGNNGYHILPIKG
jgi:DNA-binding HxlR family transcriptional regulator